MLGGEVARGEGHLLIVALYCALPRDQLDASRSKSCRRNLPQIVRIFVPKVAPNIWEIRMGGFRKGFFQITGLSSNPTSQ